MIHAQKTVVGHDHDARARINSKSSLLDLPNLSVDDLQRSIRLRAERTVFVLLMVKIGEVDQQKAGMKFLQDRHSFSRLLGVLISLGVR